MIAAAGRDSSLHPHEVSPPPAAGADGEGGGPDALT